MEKGEASSDFFGFLGKMPRLRGPMGKFLIKNAVLGVPWRKKI